MDNDGYLTLRDGRSCVQNHAHGKKQLQLKLLLPKDHLVHIDMNVMGSATKNKTRKLICCRDD